MNYHTPILLSEVLSGLHIQEGAWYVDATLGGGGYTKEILSRGGKVLGIDVDVEAITYTKNLLSATFPNFQEKKDWFLICDNFRNLKCIWEEANIPHPEGIIFDLGVSSHQLDSEERGISFRFPNASLDGRLSQKIGEPLSLVLKKLSREEIETILGTYGEEERARELAHAIVSARKEKAIETVGDLTHIIQDAIGEKKAHDALSRVFQAFRIYINDELAALRVGLEDGLSILAPKGKLVVLSFHSLEDRIVKQFFRTHEVMVLTKDPIMAGSEEIAKNRRSKSAKLRIAEKIA